MTEIRPPQRLEAGLWCTEVLAALPDLIEGDLAPAAQQQIAAHLAACDWCARFGGAYAATVQGLRGASWGEPPEDLLHRLQARIEAT